MQKFDLAIIGGGSAGYNAAVKAAKLGLNACCIEEYEKLGGTCLHFGCIPSKALLNFSKKYFDISKRKYENFGLYTNCKLDLKQMIACKDNIVQDLSNGIDFLFKRYKIKRFIAKATIIESNLLSLKGKDNLDVHADNIIIATGSKIRNINAAKTDGKFIITSDHALTLNKIPSEILVVGAGYIGLELGSFYNFLGSKVTILESSERILSSLDQDITNLLQKSLANQGINFLLNRQIENAIVKNSQVQSTIIDQYGKNTIFNSDQLLLAVGRVSNIDFLNEKNSLKIKLTPSNFIDVNEYYQTNFSNIFAIGDVIGGDMLAHKAEADALELIDFIVKAKSNQNYKKSARLTPSVVYSSPEIASVGYNEMQLQKLGIDYKIGKSSFKANGRAHTMLSTEGFVKILFCKKYHKILGGVIIGPDAGTLIAELVAYMEFGASAEDISLTIHSHPSLNEALKDAASNL